LQACLQVAKKKDMEKMKQFMEYQNQKCIKTKNNVVSDLRKDSFSTFPVFSGATEKVVKLYEEQRNHWSIRKVSFIFCILNILLCVNKLSVVIVWAFFLATQLTAAVSIDLTIYSLSHNEHTNDQCGNM